MQYYCNLILHFEKFDPQFEYLINLTHNLTRIDQDLLQDNFLGWNFIDYLLFL